MGYFRIFYYVAYIFNTLTRIIKRHGKWLLWFLCIAIFLVVCLYNPKSQAIYIGDYSYGDPNYAVNNFYKNINMDFLRRLDNYNGNNKEEFLNRFKNNRYSVYLYYGTFNGSDNIQGQTYNTNNLRIMIYRNNFVSSSTLSPSTYDNFCGIQPVDIKLCTFVDYYFYYFDGLGNLSLYSDSSSGQQQVYIPSTLINYLDDNTFDYIYNNYSLQEIEIMYDMRNKLNQANQELQTQTDYLTDEPSSDDFDSSDLPSDSGVTDPTTSQVDNIFTTVYNVFTGNVETTKRNINVSIPFTR